MEYNKINSHNFVIDENNVEDKMFIEYCRKFDNELSKYIKNIEENDSNHGMIFNCEKQEIVNLITSAK